MKTVTTGEAITILAKGLGVKSIGRSTFTSYHQSGLVTGRLSDERIQRTQQMWNEAEIIKSIERIIEINKSE